MSHPSIDAISSSFRRFFTGTLFSRFSGFARELAMAALFGTSTEVAAFWMAFRFSQLLRRLFGEGGLHVAFVPHYESLKAEEREQGLSFFAALNMTLAVVLLLLALLASLIMGALLCFGDLNPSTHSIVRLTLLMIPSFVFVSLYALNASFLQCEGKYLIASFAPTLLNLVWLAALPFLPHSHMAALECLSGVVVAGLCLSWLVTWIPTLRILKVIKKIKWPSLKDYGAILRPFGLSLIGVAAIQFNGALDAIFARFAEPEGPAILWYALRLEQLPLALVGVGVSAAFFPPLARTGDPTIFKQLLSAAIQRTLISLIPITFALLVLGLSSVNFVYGRGAFNQESTLKTTYALWAYGLGLIPSTLVFILASAFYAQKNYRLPTIASSLSVCLNCAFNALFVFVWELKATSIALATTLSATINWILLAYFLKKSIGKLEKIGGWLASKVLFCSLIATLSIILLDLFLPYDSNLSLLLGKTPHLPRAFSLQAFLISLQTLLFFTLFTIVAYLLRCHELFEMVLPKKIVATLFTKSFKKFTIPFFKK